MTYLSFRIPENFVDQYRDKPVPWGFGPMSEVTFLRSYSRKKPDGRKETWAEVCQRVTDGTFSIQKDWCLDHRIEWNEARAIKTAQEFFDRMFHFKWTPPGRGMWVMGTEFVHGRGNSAALQNCSFRSTDDDVIDAMAFLFEASMLGVGVGFDTKGAGQYVIQTPGSNVETVIIDDSREGWVDATMMLLQSYLHEAHPTYEFDYSRIREAGTPIKGYGGTAAGPGPLKKLHERLRVLFDGRGGDILTEVDVVDIANMIGVCVVAGNVRRSALIALGDGTDEFINLKNGDVFPERNDWNDGWGHLSNNSVLAEVGETDYDRLAESIRTNGEPGVFYLDLTRRYGRLIDPPTNADYRVAGTNPCSFAAETLVMTTEGPRRIDSLDGQPFWAVVNGEAYLSPGGAWVTGVDDIYTLRTKEGYEVNLTSNHKVMTASGEWVEAGDLERGDDIVLHNHRDVPFWPGGGTAEQGYLLGLFVGDGYWGGTGASVATAQVWTNDEGHEGVCDHALAAAETLPHRSDWAGWRDHGRGVLSMSVGTWVRDFGYTDANKNITEQVECASSDFQAAFLKGLFDADGHIEGWDDNSKGTTVRLGQSDRDRLVAVQRMLLRFGIKSRIYKARGAGTSVLPDGRGGTKEYATKESWRLVIGTNDVEVFSLRVGFEHHIKAEQLRKALRNTFYSRPFVATFDRLEFLRRDNVWDLTVSTKHAFDANGLYVSNSEQSLESGEMCTLVETYPTNHDDLADFQRTLKFAYLYAKSVTLLPTHWPQTNSIMQRNRRIGCSITGLAQFVDQRSMTELRTWQNKGYETITRWDRIYSEWLCVRESIKKTSVKPSGTVSLVAGVSPGVHWPTHGTYVRRMRLGVHDPLVAACKEAGYPVEPDVKDPDNTMCVSFPIRGLEGVRTQEQVSLWEKAALAVVTQRYWADNQVSCTLTFRKDEADDIAAVLRTHEGQLKSASFLAIDDVDLSYPQLPYEPISEQEFERLVADIRPLDLATLYEGDAGLEALGSKFCENDTCELPIAEPV